MIRRDVTLADGSAGWSLISQVDHARLSGDLAVAWGNPRIGPIFSNQPVPESRAVDALRREVLAAIRHHDDGWLGWESAPQIDPEHQRPPSFTEMPLDESLTIWQASIDACAQIGPLAAWMVAGHFLALRSHSSSHSDAAEVWAGQTQQQQTEWLAAWQAQSQFDHSAELAGQALGWLQAFDVLSLWLCGGAASRFRFPPPGMLQREMTVPVKWQALPSASLDEIVDISADPFPLGPGTQEFSVNAVLVPVAEYEDGDELMAAGRRHQHRWRVVGPS